MHIQVNIHSTHTDTNRYKQEEKNTLQVNATTLNNFPIKTKGTITFIEQNQNHFLIKRERFPELQNINKTEFEKFSLDVFKYCPDNSDLSEKAIA